MFQHVFVRGACFKTFPCFIVPGRAFEADVRVDDYLLESLRQYVTHCGYLIGMKEHHDQMLVPELPGDDEDIIPVPPQPAAAQPAAAQDDVNEPPHDGSMHVLQQPDNPDDIYNPDQLVHVIEPHLWFANDH